MNCEFCREEIVAETLICPHCRKKTAAGRAAAGRKAGSWILGVLVVLFVLAVIAGSNGNSRNDQVSKIDRGCERGFAGAPEAISRCKVALYIQRLEKQEAGKLKRAAGGL